MFSCKVYIYRVLFLKKLSFHHIEYVVLKLFLLSLDDNKELQNFYSCQYIF
ncbi:hypothetical protein HMPREF0023_2352 [Acinetobacter sp. ATCC 27244]|nr:hypothetical protein HMPREF0023_2352 [Acinetobacter sp. ATCC 27244]